MFSTSSSECDCTRTFDYSKAFPDIIGNAFCSSTRQPLIYFAKIEDTFPQQPIRIHKKNNANYFTKAFRWYTQEHGSSQKNGISSSNVRNGDFAAWLDRKYSEYLKGSQREKSNLTFKETKDKIFKKKSMKRFGRMHSPWGKRRSSSKEGDISHNIESFEYILPPKDLNKKASHGCCQRKSRPQSTTTTMSKESLKITEIYLKSQSVTNSCPGICGNEGRKTKPHPKNVLCECLKKDTGTQYETLSFETLATPRPKLTKTPGVAGTQEADTVITKRISRQIFPQPNVSCECFEINSKENDSSLSKPRRDEYDGDKRGMDKAKELANQGSRMSTTAVLFTDNTSMNVSKLQSLSAQTSDHSICLENVGLKQAVLLKVMHLNI